MPYLSQWKGIHKTCKLSPKLALTLRTMLFPRVTFPHVKTEERGLMQPIGASCRRVLTQTGRDIHSHTKARVCEKRKGQSFFLALPSSPGRSLVFCDTGRSASVRSLLVEARFSRPFHTTRSCCSTWDPHGGRREALGGKKDYKQMSS